MTTVYFVQSFDRQLKKLRFPDHGIVEEIRKYQRGLKNLIDLYCPYPNTKLLKGYLSGGRIRLAVLLQVKKDLFIPVFVGKKESRYGWNVSRYLQDMMAAKIQKAISDIENKKMRVVTLQA